MGLLELRLGLLGAGNMGAALACGLVASGRVDPARLTAVDPRPEALEPLSRLGLRTASDAGAAVCGQDVVVVAVKPQVAPTVLPLLRPLLAPEQILVSVMAGVSTGALQAQLPPGTPVVRAMPQVLARIGAGATALCPGAHVAASQLEQVEALFAAVGSTAVVAEGLMDAVTGLSGSGPAYVYELLQGLADGGVLVGLPRDVALRLAAQTMLGVARQVLEAGQHPGVGRDQVTSPGGTTIAGLFELEAAGVHAALMRAVRAAAERARELGRA